MTIVQISKFKNNLVGNKFVAGCLYVVLRDAYREKIKKQFATGVAENTEKNNNQLSLINNHLKGGKWGLIQILFYTMCRF